MRKNPWSRPINYATAIAEDLLWIERYESALADGLYAPESCAEKGYAYSVLDLCVADSETRERLGFTGSDVYLALQYESVADRRPTDAECVAAGIDIVELKEGWGVKARAILARMDGLWLDGLLLSREQLEGALRRARASLARHRRNQKKHGAVA